MRDREQELENTRRRAGEGEPAKESWRRRASEGELAKESRRRRAGEGELAKESWRRRAGEGELAKESWRRRAGEGELAKESWRRRAGEGEPAKESRRRRAGEGELAKESWRRRAGEQECLSYNVGLNAGLTSLLYKQFRVFDLPPTIQNGGLNLSFTPVQRARRTTVPPTIAQGAQHNNSSNQAKAGLQTARSVRRLTDQQVPVKAVNRAISIVVSDGVVETLKAGLLFRGTKISMRLKEDLGRKSLVIEWVPKQGTYRSASRAHRGGRRSRSRSIQMRNPSKSPANAVGRRGTRGGVREGGKDQHARNEGTRERRRFMLKIAYQNVGICTDLALQEAAGSKKDILFIGENWRAPGGGTTFHLAFAADKVDGVKVAGKGEIATTTTGNGRTNKTRRRTLREWTESRGLAQQVRKGTATWARTIDDTTRKALLGLVFARAGEWTKTEPMWIACSDHAIVKGRLSFSQHEGIRVMAVTDWEKWEEFIERWREMPLKEGIDGYEILKDLEQQIQLQVMLGG
ncbi:hypothetical protein BDZ91DRAFT_844725 [Kalaharituber pfeilii]|nr:hypothetical protein BDZ91DRAFT_844725 [Kalaharituber pfeilii]